MWQERWLELNEALDEQKSIAASNFVRAKNYLHLEMSLWLKCNRMSLHTWGLRISYQVQSWKLVGRPFSFILQTDFGISKFRMHTRTWSLMHCVGTARALFHLSDLTLVGRFSPLCFNTLILWSFDSYALLQWWSVWREVCRLRMGTNLLPGTSSFQIPASVYTYINRGMRWWQPGRNRQVEARMKYTLNRRWVGNVPDGNSQHHHHWYWMAGTSANAEGPLYDLADGKRVLARIQYEKIS